MKYFCLTLDFSSLIRPLLDFLFCSCFKEQFINLFLKEAHKSGKNSKDIDYRSLAKLVETDERFEFLQDIIPMKVKAADAIKTIIAENEKLDI